MLELQGDWASSTWEASAEAQRQRLLQGHSAVSDPVPPASLSQEFLPTGANQHPTDVPTSGPSRSSCEVMLTHVGK